MSGPICKYLDWDSEFFGFRVGRVTSSSLDDAGMQSVIRWAGEEYIDCLYLLCPLADVETVRRAEKAGFFIVDIRMTFEIALNGKREQVPGIRLYQESDLESLKQIAKVSHYQSRFFVDGHFPISRCEALYETWVEKSCTGGSSRVHVAAEPGGEPLGYVTCDILQDGTGSLGLGGVSEDARGQGLFQALVQASLAYFQEKGCRRAIVATQGQNITAQRLYQRCGFLTKSMELWLHCWPRLAH